MNAEFEDKEYRAAFVEEIVKTNVAFQIRALREHQEKNQGDLAQLIGTGQSVISRLEDPDYGKFSATTLFELASAFDVGLIVRFVSFGDLQKSLEDLSPKALAVASYQEEKEGQLKALDATAKDGRAWRAIEQQGFSEYQSHSPQIEPKSEPKDWVSALNKNASTAIPGLKAQGQSIRLPEQTRPSVQ